MPDILPFLAGSTIFLLLLVLVVVLLSSLRKNRQMAHRLSGTQQKMASVNGQLETVKLQRLDFDNERNRLSTLLDAQRHLLASSEERYRLMNEATRDAVWELDIIGNQAILSERTGELLGLPGDFQAWEKDWQGHIHPDELMRTREALAAYLSRRTPQYAVEYRILTADGSYRWILTKGVATFGDDGKPVRMVGTHSDINESKQQQDTISHMAYYDSLTELPNRMLLKARVESAIHMAVEQNGQVGLLFADLDNFKFVNDSFGHPAGDELLTEVAQRFLTSIAPRCTVARLGGDEFVILMPGIADRQEAANQSQWLLDQFSLPLRAHAMQFHMGMSIGIALYPDHGRTFDALMRSADTAMYAAKGSGKNQYRFFDDQMDAVLQDRVKLEGGLRNALERNELLLHYQPIHRLEDNRLVGYEALVRWQSPEHGLVSPDRFIPIAEETGLILSIGEWVLRESCRFAMLLDGKLDPDFHVAVNVSVLQLMQADFVRVVQRVLQETGIQRGTLVLEITESILMESFAQHAAKLRELSGLGVIIALDDFGTGYSSLTYLQKLPIQMLKIDKKFIDEIHAADDPASHTGSIIALAQQWGFQVVAEGVEHEYQRQYLQAQHCNMMQGYLRSRPIPELEALAYADGNR